MRIEFLCSGVALGVYTPGMILTKAFTSRGHHAAVEVLESLYEPRQHASLERARAAYAKNFKLVRASQRASHLLVPDVVSPQSKLLLNRWSDVPPDLLVVLSGHWLPLLARMGTPFQDRVRTLHIDSAASPSFGSNGGCFRALWFVNSSRSAVEARLPIGDENVVPWSDRRSSMLVHGGGWGVGTFKEACGQLLAAGISTDLIIYDESAMVPEGATAWLLDPSWRAWSTHGCPFPPLHGPSRSVQSVQQPYHASYDLLRDSLAIVSKPGGGSLLDSFASATPLLCLEPSGRHESANADVWQSLGFGIDLDEWMESGRPMAALELAHERLLEARVRVPSIVDLLSRETR